jgi:pimeloyl-ACP methyl ester carboxylesterase
MGGMIAQIVAARYPDRTRSLTSIMSSSGDPSLPQGKPEAVSALLAPRPQADDRAGIIEASVKILRIIGSPGFSTPDAELRAKVERAIDRSYYPPGIGRQMLAILASGSRAELLKQIKAPTLVIHGEDDPLVPLEAGKDTARHVAGAKLKTVPGMGHDLADGLVPILVDAIGRHCVIADSYAAAF